MLECITIKSAASWKDVGVVGVLGKSVSAGKQAAEKKTNFNLIYIISSYVGKQY
jgi:hypothetical protein